MDATTTLSKILNAFADEQPEHRIYFLLALVRNRERVSHKAER